MAGRAPRTEKWTARENMHKDHLCVIVDGVVQVDETHLEPRLAEPDTSVRGPKTLVLDLTLESGGSGGDDVRVWKPAHFHKEDVQPNQYEEVAIVWHGQPVATVKILDDREYGQHLAAITQAANIAHASARATGKKKAAKKAVAKKAVAKKKAARKKVAKKKVAKKKTVKKGVAKKRAAAARKKRPSAKKRASSRKRR